MNAEQEPKVRILVNSNSNMSRGKYAAAAVHAALTAAGVHPGLPVIVLGGQRDDVMRCATVIRDAGKTEVEPGTPTAGTDWSPALITPPANDVREAVLAVRDEIVRNGGRADAACFATLEAIASRCEVRPYGTVTEAEPVGLCNQCGEPFGEHSCVPIPSCIHVGPFPAEVRPHGTVTDAEKPERLAERYVSAFVGDRADDSSTIVYRGPLLEMVTNAVREAAEAAREVHP